MHVLMKEMYDVPEAYQGHRLSSVTGVGEQEAIKSFQSPWTTYSVPEQTTVVCQAL
ncbi:hypothetical protein SCLCIDRAFT_1222897 [Scleroderma citrinum Foug A]|uniref:Uncharacterized protein n=1 Tax=Scleroderma citrinum Foug A TaxID=1036808 RepID=A0A0C2ZL07_9AGAM|nr:hypothetical protein SCLCIDRAFT_1222897 [Scleroderma citrinum Foug A]